MGRYLLYALGGLMIVFSTTAIVLDKGRIDKAESNSQALAYAKARNTSTSGAYMAVSKMSLDNAWKEGFSKLALGDAAGRVWVEDQFSNSSLASGEKMIISVGTFGDVSETTQVNLKVPPDLGAFAVYATKKVEDLNVYNEYGFKDKSLLVEKAGSLPPIDWDALEALALTQEAVDGEGSHIIVGSEDEDEDEVEDDDDNTCVIHGGLNINPNNSPHSEFTLIKSGGGQITRDDLHKRSAASGDGTYYSGGATWIRVKPKGNGNQNTLIMNGNVYNFHNGTTYTIVSNDMTVRIWNSKMKNGRCMGHWWLDIDANDVTINGECESDDDENDDDVVVEDEDDCNFYFRDKIPNVTVVYGNLKVSDNEKLCGIFIVYGDFQLDGNAQVDGVVAMPKPGSVVMNGGSNPDIKNITGGMVVDAGITASGKNVSVKYKPEYMSIFSSFQKKSGIMLTRWLESTAY
jgi:hypothetical protein